MEGSRRIRARWILPVDQSPIEHGTIEIEQGTIVAVHQRHDPRAEDLGNVAILPGLINCHTHLEFSQLQQPIPPAQPFADWIRALVRYRRSQTDNPVAAVNAGLSESASCGVVAVGEIATTDWPLSGLPTVHPHVTVFREFLSRSADDLPAQIQAAERHIALRNMLPHCTPGLSPHASFSVHPDLLSALIQLAVRERVPLAMHLAETREELELLDWGTGTLVDMLQSFGAWRPGVFARGTRVLHLLRELAAVETGLVIHGNYLDEAERVFLSQNPQLTVIYCPRTHAYFGHQDHPWLDLLAHGALVALGTDGRGSNPDLSLWNEVRFLAQQYPTVDPSLLIELATLRGARALGLADRFGSITPGKSAALAVISLNDNREEITRAVLSQTSNPCSLDVFLNRRPPS